MPKFKAAIIIGGSLLQVPLIHEAHALGLAVICTDGDTQAPGLALAEDYRVVSTYDAQGTAAMLEPVFANFDVRGVCTAGADIAPTVAYVAERFGLRGIPYETARDTHNKATVRSILHHAGLAHYQPRWARYLRGIDLVDYPCIVKPLSQRASRGISFASNRDALMRAIDKTQQYGDAYLLEERLVGTEHSAEMIMGNKGEVLWFNIVDRFFDYTSGIPIETGHVNPTCLNWENQAKILTMVKAAAAALGVTWGPFKVDVLMTREEVRDGVFAPANPYILECTARLSGAFDSQGTSPLTGRHPIRLLLQLACGLPLEPPPRMAEAQGYAACAAILPQRGGVIARLPAWRAVCLGGDEPRVRNVIWTVKAGQEVHPAMHNGERSGFVLTHASTYKAAWEAANHTAQHLATAVEIAAL